MISNQKSITNISKGKFSDKGSKFYAFLHPINSLDSYKALIRRYKEENPNACHVCSAYRIYLNGWIDEYGTDDREPKGSSGLPILNMLKRYYLVNVAIYVVRIYGGVNLGIPGLINAYSTSALRCIESGKLFDWKPVIQVHIKYSYDMEKLISSIIKSVDGNIIKQDFNEEISSFIEIHEDKKDSFTNFLHEKTSGKVSVIK